MQLDRSSRRLAWGALLALLGGGLLAKPELLAQRFVGVEGIEPSAWLGAARSVVRALGACALVGVLAGAAWWFGAGRSARARGWILAGWGAATYCCLAYVFADWMIDDAAITFAYSENLVRGHGLVLHPNHPPEEAYSTTLWMLLLAGARALGVPVHVAGKVLCVLFGALGSGALLGSLARLEHDEANLPRAAGLGLLVILGSPFLIWSSSGLEHALQAFLLLVCVLAPLYTPRHYRFAAAGALSALVLLRPETPLVVAALCALYAWEGLRGEGKWGWLRAWPVAVFPAVAWVGLMGFRLSYFGDPLPNPFYAKASGASFIRLLNVVGSGWNYVFDWARLSGVACLLPLSACISWRGAPLTIRSALVLLGAQLAFVVYAGGDWMGEFRFVAPLLPLGAWLLAYAYGRAPRAALGVGATVVFALGTTFVGVSTARRLIEFRARPTTPTTLVANIGAEFNRAAALLGIEQPTLAHHDAGGISYSARLDLVDLAGLGNRTIAKHLGDPEFLRRYLLEERKPTFVFGVANHFAAARSRFHETPRFEEDYVRLRFEGLPFMHSDLSHVRRELVHAAPHVRLDYQGGRLREVVIEKSPAVDAR